MFGWMEPHRLGFFFLSFFFLFSIFNFPANPSSTTQLHRIQPRTRGNYGGPYTRFTCAFLFIFRIALAVRALSCSSRRRKERSHQSAVLNAGLTTTQCVRINPANIQYYTLPSSAQPLPYEPAPFSGRATPRQPAQSLHSFLSTLHAYVQPRCRHPHASFFLRGRLE